MSISQRRAEERQYSTLREAFNEVGDYKEEYRQCRDLCHYWGEPTYVTEDDILVRNVTCYTCSTGRSEAFDRFGRVLSRRYAYPEGYKVQRINAIDAFPNKAFWRGLLYMQVVNNN
ncbi:MAG: hypothetical protein NVS9B15_04730 [Acidobacteriaceae bacterium]